MEINLDGKFKLRFDPNEVRVNIDGEKIDIGARTKEEFKIKDYDGKLLGVTNYHSGIKDPDGILGLSEENREINQVELKSEDIFYRFQSKDGNEFSDYAELLQDDVLYYDHNTGATALGAYFKQKYLKWKTKSESEDSPTQK